MKTSLLQEHGLLNDKEFNELSEQQQTQYIDEVCSNQDWRLNNLYRIKNEYGNLVTFKPQKQQQKIFDGHNKQCILKTRLTGISTAIQILFLDSALFQPNTHCGLASDYSPKEYQKDEPHPLFDAAVLNPLKNLPKWIEKVVTITSENNQKVSFSNWSSISWSTSYRGHTLEMLHVSNAAFMNKQQSEELRTGTLPAVTHGSRMFIESTANGDTGFFHDLFIHAVEAAKRDKELSKSHFEPVFIPWFSNCSNTLEAPEDFTMPSDISKYFDEVESETGASLSNGQKYWYYKKSLELSDEWLKQEYPSTHKEAFTFEW